jgi:hypothetical protein
MADEGMQIDVVREVCCFVFLFFLFFFLWFADRRAKGLERHLCIQR